MWPNWQETADLSIFTEEILNRKLYFLCSVKHLGKAQLILSVYSFNSLFQFENFEKVKQEFLMHLWINTFLQFLKYKLHQGAVLKYSDMMY